MIHAKLNRASSAVQLAETQLAIGSDAKASQVLSTLSPDQATPASQALLAIALARQGQDVEAEKIAAGIANPDNNDPGTLYILARMQATLATIKQRWNC